MTQESLPPPPQREPSAAEILSQDSATIDCLFLVMHGIPFDVAFSLEVEERLAWTVIIGQLKGLIFNWDTHTWEQRKA
jgi:hypothetical protein